MRNKSLAARNIPETPPCSPDSIGYRKRNGAMAHTQERVALIEQHLVLGQTIAGLERGLDPDWLEIERLKREKQKCGEQLMVLSVAQSPTFGAA